MLELPPANWSYVKLYSEASDENLNKINNHNGKNKGRKPPRWKENYHLMVTAPNVFFEPDTMHNN